MFKIKSIALKVLLTYILISIISFSCIAVAISVVFSKQTFDLEKEFLEGKASEIKLWGQRLLDREIEKKEFDSYLQFMDMTEDIKVKFISKKKGEKLFNDYESDETGIIDAGILAEVLNGRNKFYQSSQNKGNTTILVLGMPFQDKKGIEGAIFIYTSVDKASRRINLANKTIALTFLILFIPTTLLLIIVTKKFTKPLILMSKKAYRFSENDFSQRIDSPGIDEIGILADSLNNMADRLQHLENMRREFIAGISHEIRTPLTTIRANLQGFLDGIIKDNEKEKYLKITIDETQRLTNLLNELMELSFMDSGNVKLNMETIDISALVSSVATQIELIAIEKGDALKTFIQKGMKGCIDEERIKQVLINLLDNALKHSVNNITITIRAKIEDYILSIEVEDNGKGINQNHLPFLFERFYKIDKDKGSGLGLFICKSIIEAHGGKISVESSVSKGTKFSIEIPI